MNQHEIRMGEIVGSLSSLNGIHEKFLTHIGNLSEPSVKGGKLCVSGKQIVAIVLGITCTGIGRPIAAEGKPTAMEYAFVATFEGKDEAVQQLYLSKGGQLFFDAELKRSFGDYDSEDLLL